MDTAATRRAAVALGVAGEDQVALALQDDGWTVRDRNCHCGGGELDLVVERDGHIQFIEVKTRAAGDPVSEEAVNRTKRRKLTRAAEAWLAKYSGPFSSAIFTVAMVEGAAITWYNDAFDAEY